MQYLGVMQCQTVKYYYTIENNIALFNLKQWKHL